MKWHVFKEDATWWAREVTLESIGQYPFATWCEAMRFVKHSSNCWRI